MLLNSIKTHFASNQFSLIHDNPTLFISSQWQLDKTQPSVFYLTYRLLLGAFFLVTWSMSLGSTSSWPVFLTNWGYTICTLQALVASIMVLVSICSIRIFKTEKGQMYILKIHHIYWIMHIMATTIGFMITVIFWAVLYRVVDFGAFSAMNFFVHGANSILLFLDLWVVGHPVRILHFVYPLLFGTAYVLFSVIHHFYDKNRGGKGYVYPILNWDDPLTAGLVCFGQIFFLTFLHELTFLVYKLREMLHRRVYGSQTESTQQLNKDDMKRSKQEVLSHGA